MLDGCVDLDIAEHGVQKKRDVKRASRGLTNMSSRRAFRKQAALMRNAVKLWKAQKQQKATPSTPDDAPNPRNRWLAPGDVSELLSRYGVEEEPVDVLLYRTAMVHRSVRTATPNERMEFLGDSVIGLATTQMLYRRCVAENEGGMTRMKSVLVSGEMLAYLARQVGLQDRIIMSNPVEAAGGRRNDDMLEDCYEALVGAIFLDLGYARSEAWHVAVIDRHAAGSTGAPLPPRCVGWSDTRTRAT
jgi:dsRNA-specific ribonuclease